MPGQAITAQKAAEGDNLEKFSFSKPFYDLSTYVGRFKNIWSSTNPVLFLVTKQNINDAQSLLKHYKLEEQEAKKRNESLMITKAEINKIKKADSIVRSAVHPDTGEIIP